MTQSRTSSSSALYTFIPLISLLGAIASLSVGSSFAKHLFPLVGASGTTAYRTLGAMLLLGVIWRPWRVPLRRSDALSVARYGAVLGLMNLLFYHSLRTLPLGIATAIEFSGPLALAVILSRRLADFGWIALAVAGLVLLLPFQDGATSLDIVGVGFALGAAVCWALYIVFGKRVGHLHGGQSVALGMAAATVITLPFGLYSAGMELVEPANLLMGLVVAILSSAIPYSLEMVALQRLPRHAFGVLQSIEPALGAVAAFLILGESLTLSQWLAIVCIMSASVGISITSKYDEGQYAVDEVVH